jgi:hypothetical protein
MDQCRYQSTSCCNTLLLHRQKQLFQTSHYAALPLLAAKLSGVDEHSQEYLKLEGNEPHVFLVPPCANVCKLALMRNPATPVYFTNSDMHTHTHTHTHTQASTTPPTRAQAPTATLPRCPSSDLIHAKPVQHAKAKESEAKVSKI